MSSVKCKGTTKSGAKCNREAGSSGYCYAHDPKAIAERETQNQALKLKSKFAIPSKRFSERQGFKHVSEVIQVDDISKDLRHSLWNVLSNNFLLQYSNSITWMFYGKRIDEFIKYLWIDFFKKPIDDLSSFKSGQVNELRELFDRFEWFEVYDFLEVTLNYFESVTLVEEVNNILNREFSGFRFVGGVFTDITTEQEVKMLEDALTGKRFPAVASHLQRALTLMSDRKNPDYRNSIKESISAVESIAKEITGKPKATLGEALKVLEVSNKIHPSLKESFSKLYGYTSDEGGIRHAMLSEPNLTAADAKFFLLSCTSFINYLKSKI
ncbi:AbiJ-NTD4 domain-containing protein [Phormidium tenue]|uniref:HEPN AbiJ-N-terminal domain-containing protein n=1 Tax=Phormidium tenue FACHB-1050 TaxID=2692857 RepID=A0ABR8CA85_9CYAN|nr:DUF5763 domain-containing protein [Phormidium tenue]MBD2317090.1 hypothetical protein [Phormidium tenue FACHB-1050]